MYRRRVKSKELLHRGGWIFVVMCYMLAGAGCSEMESCWKLFVTPIKINIENEVN